MEYFRRRQPLTAFDNLLLTFNLHKRQGGTVYNCLSRTLVYLSKQVKGSLYLLLLLWTPRVNHVSGDYWLMILSLSFVKKRGTWMIRVS